MAKKKDDSLPGPDPLPQVGDQVEYIWPEHAPVKLRGKCNGAKVLSVHDGFDGRLLDLEVDSGEGLVTVKRAPYRDAEDDAGNTWHYPPDEKPAPKAKAKTEADK